MDMVLNSLTSSGMIAASLACMGRAGRFVEVGKNGIWSAARMAQVRAQGPDVSVKGCEGRLPSGPLACTHGCHRSALMLPSTLLPWTSCRHQSALLC